MEERVGKIGKKGITMANASLTTIASLATAVTKMQANGLCWFLIYQEKLPKEADKFRRK